MKKLYCFASALLLTGSSFAQHTASISGEVRDAATSELLIGATLQIENIKATTELDGHFNLKHVPNGTYKLSVRYVGYGAKDTTVVVNGDMHLSFSLENTSAVLSDVVVASTGNRESDSYARRLEKVAPGVINTVSANAIALSPDVTIAGVLQRVSGVSMQKSSGNGGTHAIIRGMDQRYNYTLINGIKIPSPDNKYRYVPMDLFPSDLVERVEVHKTLTPDMEGDAVGGVVNMVMKNAPSSGLYLKASAAAGFSENVLKDGYNKFDAASVNKNSLYRLNGPDYIAQPGDFSRENYNYTHKDAPVNSYATLAIGNRFLDNKLGVMLGLSYQNEYSRYKGFYAPTEPLNADGSYLIKHMNVRDYSSRQQRTAGSLKLDYAFNPNNKISFYGLYARLLDEQARLTEDTLMSPPRSNFGNGEIWYMGRSKYQDQNILNTTLQGEHRVSDAFSLDWSAVYSKAKNNLPDYGEFEHDGGIRPDGNLIEDIIQDFKREWWRNDDRDLAGYLNLHYTGNASGLPYTISLGGMYRDKQRNNYYDAYTLKPLDANGNQQIWDGIDNFDWYVSTPKGTPASANNYTAYEKIAAGYAMAKVAIHQLEIVAGARVEQTKQGYTTQLPETDEGKFASYNYTNVLPSANLKYLLNSQSNLRLAYFAAINRPGFFEPVPFSLQGDDFVERGNFNVRHATAHNLDLRYELYLPKNSQLLVGAFYKAITDPIEYGFNFTGNQTDVAYQPNNYGNATNFGMELVAEKYVGKFGIRANYTYTHSSITTAKRLPFKDAGGATSLKIQNETRPLQGQSAHLANAALIYKNIQSGTDIQLNWQFTGKRIVLVSPYYGLDYWMRDSHSFDFSAEQKMAKHVFLFAKVENLLNTKYEVYVKKQPSNINIMPYQNISSGQVLVERSETGRRYQVGVRFDLNKK